MISSFQQEQTEVNKKGEKGFNLKGVYSLKI